MFNYNLNYIYIALYASKNFLGLQELTIYGKKNITY